MDKEQARHAGLAPYMDFRVHRFVAFAKGFRYRKGANGKGYYNLLVGKVREVGKEAVVTSHCWIKGKAFEGVLDVHDANERKRFEDCKLVFHAKVGIYRNGYCIERVTHLETQPLKIGV